MKEQGFDIRFYNKYIPEEVFKDEVIAADIIINAIKLETFEYGVLLQMNLDKMLFLKKVV